MKETRTINLNGLVYHIDYDAYQLLRDYLHDIELRLPQEDRQEVIADIEARIAFGVRPECPSEGQGG